MELKYKVTGQQIRKDLFASAIDLRPGTRNIAYLAFNFDESWNGMIIVCEFLKPGEKAVYRPLKGNRVLIPDEFCDESFEFRLQGRSGRKEIATEKKGVHIE